MAKYKVFKNGEFEEIDLEGLKKDELLDLLRLTLPNFQKIYDKKMEFENAFKDAQEVVKLKEEEILKIKKEKDVNFKDLEDSFKKQLMIETSHLKQENTQLQKENQDLINKYNTVIGESKRLGEGIMKLDGTIDQMKLVMNQEYVAMMTMISTIQSDYVEKKEVKDATER